jgi:cellulose biosynthesis protein BcsQ
MYSKDKFPERLRAAFNDARNTDIARQLGVSKATVTLYMGGRLPPSEVLLKIAEETGCNLHWLMIGQGPKWAHPSDAQPEREARVIALYNSGAGGTGNSTAAVFIALSLAKRGYRTLLVEPYGDVVCSALMFPQFLFEMKIGKYVREYDRDMTRQLFKTPVEELDMHVGSPQRRAKLLEQGVQNFSAVPSELRRKYSFVIVDTGRADLLHNLDLLRARLIMSSQVLISCDAYRCESSIEGSLLNLESACAQSSEIQILGAFINIADPPERRATSAKSEIARLLPGKAFKTVVHRDPEINKALVKGVGAHALGAKVKAVREFDNLTEEILLAVGC